MKKYLMSLYLLFINILVSSVSMANPWIVIENKAADLSDNVKILNAGVTGNVYMDSDATNPFKIGEKVGSTLRHDFYVGKSQCSGGAYVTIGTDYNNYCKLELQLARNCPFGRDDIINAHKIVEKKGSITCGDHVVDSSPREDHVEVFKAKAEEPLSD